MLSYGKGLGVALVLASLTAASRAADVARYVPADAEQVAHVNVRQILSSPLAKKYLLPQIEKAIKENKDLQKVLGAVDLDPLKDVVSITASNTGTTGEKALVIFNGKFNAEKIAAAAASNKDVKSTKVGGKTVYESQSKGKTVYSAVVGEDTLVISPNKDYVTDALAGKTSKLNKALETAIAAVDSRQSVWGATVITEELKKKAAEHGDNPGAALVPKLKAVLGGINITDAVAVSVQVQTTDAAAAKELGEFVDAAKVLLGAAAQGEAAPFVNDVMKSLKVKAEQNAVNISFKFSAETVDKAIKKLPR